VCPVARALEVAGRSLDAPDPSGVVAGEVTASTTSRRSWACRPTSYQLASRRWRPTGWLERRRYSERPPRYEYHATAKGKELDGVLLMLRSWGTKWCGLDKGRPGGGSSVIARRRSGRGGLADARR